MPAGEPEYPHLLLQKVLQRVTIDKVNDYMESDQQQRNLQCIWDSIAAGWQWQCV
jgi:hypothetical protein